MKKRVLFIFIILLLAVFDQATKQIALKYLSSSQPPINIFFNFIYLKLVFNDGVSFGLLSHQGSDFIWLVMLLLTFLIIIYIFNLGWSNIDQLSKLGFASFCMIIGGALGNAFDRLFYRQVVDFMYFKIPYTSFINNFADDFITFGAIFILVEGFLLRYENSTINIIFKK